MSKLEHLRGRNVQGKYKLQEPVGSGSFGSVFAAQDMQGHRHAIKVFKGPEDTNEAVREANVMKRLTHPTDHSHVVKFHELLTEQIKLTDETGRETITMLPMIAMQFANRGHLGRLIREKGVLPPAEAVKYVVQIASGTQHAHDRDVLHRDLKPANVLLHEDETGTNALITDFGIAFPDFSDPDRTEELLTKGTLIYMAPEQFRTQAEPASDQYSLGIMFHQMLTGSTPFNSDVRDDRKILLYFQDAHANTPPPTLPEGDPKVEALNESVQRALAKNPKDRFPTIEEFADAAKEALERAQTEENKDRTVIIVDAPTLKDTEEITLTVQPPTLAYTEIIDHAITVEPTINIALEEEKSNPLIEKAKELLGKDFLGVEAIQNLEKILKDNGIEKQFDMDHIPPFPYTERDLEIAKEQGEMLVLRPGSVTLKDLKDLLDGKEFSNGMSFRFDKIFKLTDNDELTSKWALVKKDAIKEIYTYTPSNSMSGDDYKRILEQRGADNVDIQRRSATEAIWDTILYLITNNEPPDSEVQASRHHELIKSPNGYSHIDIDQQVRVHNNRVIIGNNISSASDDINYSAR